MNEYEQKSDDSLIDATAYDIRHGMSIDCASIHAAGTRLHNHDVDV